MALLQELPRWQRRLLVAALLLGSFVFWSLVAWGVWRIRSH